MTNKVSKLTILLLKKTGTIFSTRPSMSMYTWHWLIPWVAWHHYLPSITLSLAMLKPWIITIPIIMMIMIMITIINNSWRQSFCDIRNNQGQDKCYQPSRMPRLTFSYRDLDYLGSQKTKSNNCFILHCFEENNGKHTVARNLNWYCY